MVKFDNNLIYYCSEDARIRLKELSNLTGKSPQRLKYNLQRMMNEKILYSPHPIIDYSFFGFLLFRIYFKGSYIGEKDKLNTILELQDHPSVVSIYELGGEFDLVIEFEVPNASRFNKELKKLTYKIRSLNNYKVVLNIVTHIFSRQYLLPGSLNSSDNFPGASPSRNIIVGGDRQRESFSKGEQLVLQNLLHNPLIHFTNLARKSSLNVKTVMTILKNLQKRRILRGYHFLIDTNNLGINKHRLFFKLHNLTPERENALIEHCIKIPEIVQVNKTVGDWDLEIDIESLDKNAVRYLIAGLREEFTDVIETFNNMEFYQNYKKTFLPESLFREPEQ